MSQSSLQKALINFNYCSQKPVIFNNCGKPPVIRKYGEKTLDSSESDNDGDIDDTDGSEDTDSAMSEAEFLNLLPSETPQLEYSENEEDATVSIQPFYKLLKPKNHLNRNGFYPPELINAKSSYFGADGNERETSNLTHIPVDELYYPEQ